MRDHLLLQRWSDAVGTAPSGHLIPATCETCLRTQRGPGLGEEEEEAAPRKRQTHQVILQRVGPDVVFDDFAELVGSSV